MKKSWLWAILPFVALITSIVIFLSTDPLSPLGVSAPPLENLTVERTVLGDRGISLLVRAEGSEPMQIAQVQVDGSTGRLLKSLQVRYPDSQPLGSIFPILG